MVRTHFRRVVGRRLRTAVVASATLAYFGALAVARLALHAGPSTWIVDDDGGPGVSFTDIQPAIDTALDGDLILVRSGTYGSFTLYKNLTILGEPNVRSNIGTANGIDGEAAVAEISFSEFKATACSGTLVLDSIVFFEPYDPSLTIEDCADVRVLWIGADVGGREPEVVVDNSKVELANSGLRGTDGRNNEKHPGYTEGWDGTDGIRVIADGRVYVACTQTVGGSGGDATDMYYSGGCGYAGSGGSGVAVDDGEVLLLGRGNELVKGGSGGDSGPSTGWNPCTGYAGSGGDGLYVGIGSTARYSSVNLKGGVEGIAYLGGTGYVTSGSHGKKVYVAFLGSATKATPPDPSLERTAVAVAGGTANIKLRTEPNVYSRLFVGDIPTIQSSPMVFVDNLVIKEVTYGLGFAPASGVINASFPLDPSWKPGTVIYAQAMSIFPGGEIRRTNSVPFVVR